jgi:hypothetical protein
MAGPYLKLARTAKILSSSYRWLSWPLVQSRHVAESRGVTHRRTLVLISCMHRESRRRWSKSGSLRHYEPDATREFDALVNVTSIGHDRIIPMPPLKAFSSEDSWASEKAILIVFPAIGIPY